MELWVVPIILISSGWWVTRIITSMTWRAILGVMVVIITPSIGSGRVLWVSIIIIILRITSASSSNRCQSAMDMEVKVTVGTAIGKAMAFLAADLAVKETAGISGFGMKVERVSGVERVVKVAFCFEALFVKVEVAFPALVHRSMDDGKLTAGALFSFRPLLKGQGVFVAEMLLCHLCSVPSLSSLLFSL